MYVTCMAKLIKLKKEEKINEQEYKGLTDLVEELAETIDLEESLEIAVGTSVYEYSYDEGSYYVNLESGEDTLALEGNEYDSNDLDSVTDMVETLLDKLLATEDLRKSQFSDVYAIE